MKSPFLKCLIDYRGHFITKIKAKKVVVFKQQNTIAAIKKRLQKNCYSSKQITSESNLLAILLEI